MFSRFENTGSFPFRVILVRVMLELFMTGGIDKGTFRKQNSRLLNNYSTRARSIWSLDYLRDAYRRVGYNHFLSNKPEKNNCFIKISRINKFSMLILWGFSKRFLWAELYVLLASFLTRTFHVKVSRCTNWKLVPGDSNKMLEIWFP